MKTLPLERRSLLQELTLRGVRITEQRRILIEIIQTADRHLDAATLLSLAQEKDGQIDRDDDAHRSTSALTSQP